jgi:penicillin-binding protein 1A
VGRRFLSVVLGGCIATALCIALAIPAVLTVAGAGSSRGPRLVPLRTLAQRSSILDADGNLLGRLGLQDRVDVPLSAVPKILQDAVIAVEDQTFWDNPGIDVHGTLRAALANLKTGRVEEGGSTITQQLVKNRVLTSKRTADRKLREMVLAVEYANHYSKQQVLGQYLNTVYFGQGAYGVQSAMERLFLRQGPFGPYSPPLSEITIGQAALLAGLIANPEGDNPFDHPDRAAARRDVALGRMVDLGDITQAQADAAKQEPLPSILPTSDLRPRTSWVEEVQDQLVNDPRYTFLGNTSDAREHRLLTGGFTVQTTLDPAVQQAAQDAMDAILPEKEGFTGALVAMDPNTGTVKAMVAGPGFEQSQYNIATTPPGRQAGSTWKVITLAAALNAGMSPNDVVDGSSPCEFPPPLGRTENVEPGFGPMTLRTATVNSVNCAFARTEVKVGFSPIIDLAHAMGIRQQTLAPVLTLTLGAIETTPLEMATVASTIASGGVRHWPSFVSKVLGPDGKVLYDAATDQGQRVLSPDVAACETDILRGVVTGGTGTNAQLADGRPVAGKTGTTDGRSDANFLGFTPQLAAFIWHGNANGRVPGAGFGGDVPARIFKRFMGEALAGAPVLQFPDPGPICARPPTQPVIDESPGQPQPPAPPQAAPRAPAPTTSRPTTPPTVPPTTTPPTTPPTAPPTVPPTTSPASAH